MLYLPLNPFSFSLFLAQISHTHTGVSKTFVIYFLFNYDFFYPFLCGGTGTQLLHSSQVMLRITQDEKQCHVL